MSIGRIKEYRSCRTGDPDSFNASVGQLLVFEAAMNENE
jgi:hypothetical protein